MAIAVEHQDALGIWPPTVAPSTILFHVKRGGERPGANDLLLERFMLTDRATRKQHGSAHRNCEETENVTSTHGTLPVICDSALCAGTRRAPTAVPHSITTSAAHRPHPLKLSGELSFRLRGAYLARFHTISTFPPPDPVGLVHFSSSPVRVM